MYDVFIQRETIINTGPENSTVTKSERYETTWGGGRGRMRRSRGRDCGNTTTAKGAAAPTNGHRPYSKNFYYDF